MSRLPKLIDLIDQKQFRIIPSVYPPINFFEDLVDPSEMETLWEIESLTNERIRHEAGDIFLVKPEDRVVGSGSSVVMASFTHIYQPSRFSDGSYGVYYAGLSQETAIRETVFHRERFLNATHEAPCELTMRLYVGRIKKPLHDIRTSTFKTLHNPSDYSASQQFGQVLREKDAWGIIYNSIRHPDGCCIAALRPPAVSIPKQTAHFKYIWDGTKIVDVLETKSILKL